MAHILLLEDEAPLRMLIAETLEDHGHTVTQSADGKIVLDTEAVLRADVMITDIIMPELDGLEAITRAKAINPRLKIVAMSGGGRVITRDFLPDAEAFGATITLQKPFMATDVIDAVKTLLAA